MVDRAIFKKKMYEKEEKARKAGGKKEVKSRKRIVQTAGMQPPVVCFCRL